ncbi:MAG: FtsH protease activity modulator HflK [Minwuiales bacterium]|nr:FtsH protease activity modulator HflK [Minwuiales bacterium]
MMPGSTGGGVGILVVILVVLAIWMASGFYRVQTDEQGVVLRFGEWIKTTQPGLNYHLPYPIETVLTPKVTRVNRIEVGFRSAEDFGRSVATRDVPEEGLMLTGDENIVDVNFTVFWVINDAGKFLFNIDRPEVTVKAVAESAMREVSGRTPIQSALTEGRGKIETETQELMQSTLDEYGAGILIQEVKMQRVDPPSAVIDAFRDVQAAEADRVRLQNEAEAYANDIIPRARGDSARILQEAEGYKQQKIAEAEGEAARFLSVYAEFSTAPDVTSRRLYLETMEEIFAGMDKVILDSNNGGGGSGVVPYLPLNELRRNQRTQGTGQ